MSTDEQATRAQEIELRAAAARRLSRTRLWRLSVRPALAKLIHEIGAGDTLVVVRLYRLGRSVLHLLEVIEYLTEKCAHFRSLQDLLDATTQRGMFSLQVLGAVAQIERALISVT